MDNYTCDFCNPAGCKSEDYDIFVKQKKKQGYDFNRVIYICDGKNDYCLARNLKPNDIVFVRKGFELDDYLNKEGKIVDIKAEVKYWDTSEELLEFFNKSYLINKKVLL